MDVTIYTTTSSQNSIELKKFLTEKGVQYLEKLIDQDLKAREEMKTHSDGYLGVPFIYITKEGVEHKIIGFNEKRLNMLF